METNIENKMNSQPNNDKTTPSKEKTFATSNLGQVGGVAKGKMEDLRKSVRDGDYSIRLLALAAGVALMISATMGLLLTLMRFDITKALMDLYTFILGAVALILESRQLSLPDDMYKAVFKYALFLKFVWGRGCLYFVAGTLQLAQATLIGSVVGLFVMCVGALYIVVGQRAAKKLEGLREELDSEFSLNTRFAEADLKCSGTLDLQQFIALTSTLGMRLTPNEAEAAFLHMNKADNGELTFEEFHDWWMDREETGAIGHMRFL